MNPTTALALTWAAILFNVVLTLQLARRLRVGAPPPRPPASQAGPAPASQVPVPPLRLAEAGMPAVDFSVTTVDGDMFGVPGPGEPPLTVVYLSDHCASCRANFPRVRGVGDLARRAGEHVLLAFIEDSPETRASSVGLAAEFDFGLPLAVVPPGHPLLSAYNASEATPAFVRMHEGAVIGSGVVGSQTWDAMIKTWRANDRTRAVATR